MWRSNAVMYVTVPYNKVLFIILYFLTSQSEVDFEIAHVQVKWGKFINCLHKNNFARKWHTVPNKINFHIV
jgi:hypothetical protein